MAITYARRVCALFPYQCVAVADSDAAVVKALLKSEKCQINALDSNYRYDAYISHEYILY